MPEPPTAVGQPAVRSHSVIDAERKVLLFLLATVALVSGTVLALGYSGTDDSAAAQPELWVAAPVFGLLFLVLLWSSRFLLAAKVLIVLSGVVVVHGRLGLAFYGILQDGYSGQQLPPMAVWAVLVTAVSMMMFRGTAGRVVGLSLFGATVAMVLAFVAGSAATLPSSIGFALLNQYVVGHGAIAGLLLLYHHVDLVLQSERERANQLQHLARTDELTQLGNRRAGTLLLERILVRLQRGDDKSFGLIMFDLDHFKSINDNHGHHVGDRVLVGVATHTAALTRPWDTLCRWGGEEFIAIIADADVERTYAIAQRIQEGIESLQIGDAPPVTASFGVTQVRPEDSFASLLDRIDGHLYEAKGAGRNCVRPLPPQRHSSQPAPTSLDPSPVSAVTRNTDSAERERLA